MRVRPPHGCSKLRSRASHLAQYNLGSCYINGEGVDRNLNDGYFWIFLANARTTESDLKGLAETSLEALTKVMKKGDVKSAQKRGQAWLNEHPLKAQQ
jgi:TPR repeat protein